MNARWLLEHDRYSYEPPFVDPPSHMRTSFARDAYETILHALLTLEHLEGVNSSAARLVRHELEIEAAATWGRP